MQSSRLAIHSVALGAMIVTFLASAQAPKGHGRLDDPFLDNLVGAWSISRHIRGTVVENSMQAQWVLNHQFVQLHMRGVGDPPAYEALVLVGFDPSTSRYVAHWCDDFGGQYSAVGYGKRSGNAIEFTFSYPDGPFHNTFTWDPSARGWTFLMESEDAKGQRRLFAQDTVRRK